jgi:3-hydroxyacyl-[acyl-carrier-protein] dehydratase
MKQDQTVPELRKLDTVDIQRIMQLLPHRYPFLLVDRIIEMDGDRSCIGIKNVTANEPQFTGHFPGQPLFPGVLIIEGMAQTAGALVVHSNPDVTRGVKHVLFTTIDNAKFRKPVIPGDQLQYRMTKIAQKRSIWFFRGEAMVDGVLVAEANLSAMVVMN